MANVPFLERQLAEVLETESGQQIWEMSAITSMDTAGAWLVRRSLSRLEQKGRRVELRGLRAEFEQLIRWISADEGESVAGQPQKPGMIDRLGHAAWNVSLQGLGFLSFVGE
ncbi:MAG: STAS domain-containing protein, partial [Deltaproteobacteria bacterium]|nr:STAS domain-containing protein [Deltaproteobacteria bacterium]